MCSASVTETIGCPPRLAQASAPGDPGPAGREPGILHPAARALAAILLLVAGAPSPVAAATPVATRPRAAIAGLDHIPVAVSDLEAAAADYRRLGFTLKPGRVHANGIRNVHAKFRDGTEIELITATASTDAATSRYLAFLAGGDGPAYLGFYVPELARFRTRLAAAGERYDDDPAIIWPEPMDDGHYLFFGHRNASPTDRPEHFRHENGAERLIGVWIATDRDDYARRLLALGGARFAPEWVHAPGRMRVPVGHFAEAEVVLLPGSRQPRPGREIAGAVLLVASAARTAATLGRNGISVPPIVRTRAGRSVFVSSAETHGLSLEFREPRRPVPRPRMTKGSITVASPLATYATPER